MLILRHHTRFPSLHRSWQGDFTLEIQCEKGICNDRRITGGT